MEAAWRLIWALPLVMLIGVTGTLLLKRFVVPTGRATQQAKRMCARESICLSEQTRMHLIDVDEKTYLVLESTQHAQLQAVLTTTSEGSRMAALGPWLKRFQRQPQ